MSVTFSLPSTETAWPLCESCGGSGRWYPGSEHPRSEPECETCQGYGPGPVDSTPTLNVANGNAWVLIHDVLGFSEGEVSPYYGELEPEDLMVRLATAPLRAPNAVRETVQHGNMISCGLPLERIQRYCEVLAHLAALAIRRREPVIYG